MSVHRDTDSAADAEDFAERWSRRKREATQEAVASPPEPAEPSAESVTETPPPLTDADMPPLETLDERSDYAGFMAPGVSEHLRAQALRKLFRLPGLHVPDGLDDYDDDFTKFTSLGNTVTHEMRRMLAREVASIEAAEDPSPDEETESAAAAKAVSGQSGAAVPEQPQPTTTVDAVNPADDTRNTEGQS